MIKKCELIEYQMTDANGFKYRSWYSACNVSHGLPSQYYTWEQAILFNYCPNCGLKTQQISLKGEKI